MTTVDQINRLRAILDELRDLEDVAQMIAHECGHGLATSAAVGGGFPARLAEVIEELEVEHGERSAVEP